MLELMHPSNLKKCSLKINGIISAGAGATSFDPLYSFPERNQSGADRIATVFQYRDNSSAQSHIALGASEGGGENPCLSPFSAELMLECVQNFV
jgi:hypothetical protein